MASVNVDPRTDYLLRLGDDALVLGQRLGEWCGEAPVLEVDLSLANLALDLIGQATHLLGAAGDADRLAFHRDVLDFRNCLLVEQPNGDFAQTIARQLLFSTWQHMLFERLTSSSDQFLARVRGQGGQGSRLPPRAGERMDDPAGRRDGRKRAAHGRGLDWCWRFIPELFEVDEALQAAIDAAIAPDPRAFEEDYRSAHRRGAGRSETGSARGPTPDPRRPARPSQRASRPYCSR